jgi:hypothetical protein
MAGRSQGNSTTASPALRPSSGQGPYDSQEYLPGPAVHTRDEGVFYQAETQMLTRENQMLKLRIRELGMSCHILLHARAIESTNMATERQLSEMNPTSPAPALHSPAHESNLHISVPASNSEASAASTAT